MKLPEMPVGLWTKLESDIDPTIPGEWRDMGWHFCWEWDGLLIGPTMEEWDACRCPRKVELDGVMEMAGME